MNTATLKGRNNHEKMIDFHRRNAATLRRLADEEPEHRARLLRNADEAEALADRMESEG